jgi:hypothetical protein
MVRLKVGVCRYILDRVDNIKSFDEYVTLMKNAPKFLRDCRYCLRFDEKEIAFIIFHNLKPKTRFQYYIIKALSLMDEIHYHMLIKHLIKFENSDLNEWHKFKSYMHYKGPYSVSKLGQLLQTIVDGFTIYYSNYNNPYGVDFDEVKGSPSKLLQRAIFNHRKEQLMRKMKLLDKPNRKMPKPPVALPDWIEALRLKSQHDLLIAGIECNHCIGSFTDSNDIFVRESDVCAQIDIHTLKIIQCVDKNDKITQNSMKLERRLDKSLEIIRREYIQKYYLT